ncbi:hypothetical protein Pmar_PMAR001387 [Perkinsus marinus ATCC 50983]|uniref:RRM domain-containing protein n=1 Tax=Perkinsus marinus (strain ATCC 50983 / TXsc) TaxID=423536 RepID=C5KJK3_PERM5|nr:hypothetical protein Pmar_PMAR001387 [Perkinsus marinus ATCC 50983]EER15337.1 hypothetical protein Pmar_PMAR001387 [Perkinsus marinus ATCC 50983]|eukprot:XP_002783541.1 hypothetical protein Pmar_PMAR001387 [Perkinsus marinus ATCC 50983]
MVDKGEVDEDSQEDVKKKCDTYGTVEEVKVVEVGDEVRVFVVFADVSASKKIMHGRTFDQKAFGF